MSLSFHGDHAKGGRFAQSFGVSNTLEPLSVHRRPVTGKVRTRAADLPSKNNKKNKLTMGGIVTKDKDLFGAATPAEKRKASGALGPAWGRGSAAQPKHGKDGVNHGTHENERE